MGAIRAVLFDFGNTLFGHVPLDATIERCAASIGTPVDRVTARSIAGEIDVAAHAEAELLRGRDLDDAVWDERWRFLYGIADRWVAGLGRAVMEDMHHPERWVPYRSTIDVVRSLAAAGISIGVVSNTGWDVRRVFDSYGLAVAVDRFVLSYEAGLVKPDPRIFRVACEQLRSSPDETVMVGDDARADSGAAAAGLRVLLLPIVEPGQDNGLDAVSALAGVS